MRRHTAGRFGPPGNTAGRPRRSCSGRACRPGFGGRRHRSAAGSGRRRGNRPARRQGCNQRLEHGRVRPNRSQPAGRRCVLVLANAAQSKTFSGTLGCNCFRAASETSASTSGRAFSVCGGWTAMYARTRSNFSRRRSAADSLGPCPPAGWRPPSQTRRRPRRQRTGPSARTRAVWRRRPVGPSTRGRGGSRSIGWSVVRPCPGPGRPAPGPGLGSRIAGPLLSGGDILTIRRERRRRLARRRRNHSVFAGAGRLTAAEQLGGAFDPASRRPRIRRPGRARPGRRRRRSDRRSTSPPTWSLPRCAGTSCSILSAKMRR